MVDAPDALVELGIILLALGGLGRIAHRLSISPIPFYLLLGLAFGTGGIMPFDASREFVELAASIGVILLLLLLGLEYSAEELLGSMRSTTRSGILDAALNFTPGFLLGMAIGWDLPAATALGGVTYVSSSGIIAKLIEELNRYANRETPIVLSLLVFEDLAMALYLPVVTGLLMHSEASVTVRVVAIALSAVVFAFLLALRFGQRLSTMIGRPKDEVMLLIILGATLLVAGAAEHLHISAGVGAFMVGITLSGPVARGARQLLTPLRDLFAATFFVFFGLRADPTRIADVAVLAIGLAIVTTFTKIITGWVAARRSGVGQRGALRAGCMLVARGEFSIVIAGLATTMPDIPSNLAPLVATYVLIMAITGPLVARVNFTNWAGFSRRDDATRIHESERVLR